MDPYDSANITITTPTADEVIDKNATISAQGTVSSDFRASTVRLLVFTNDTRLDAFSLREVPIDVPVDPESGTWQATLPAPTYEDGTVASGDFYVEAKLVENGETAVRPIEIAVPGNLTIDSIHDGQTIVDADVPDGWLAVSGHVSPEALAKHPNLEVGVWGDSAASSSTNDHPSHARVDPSTGEFVVYRPASSLAQGHNKMWVGNTDFSVFAQVSFEAELTASATIDEPTANALEGPSIQLSGTVTNPESSVVNNGKSSQIGISVDGVPLVGLDGKPINVALMTSGDAGNPSTNRWVASFQLADVGPGPEHTIALSGQSRGQRIDVTRVVSVDPTPTLKLTAPTEHRVLPSGTRSVYVQAHATNWSYGTNQAGGLWVGVDSPVPTAPGELNRTGNFRMEADRRGGSSRNDFGTDLYVGNLKDGDHTMFVAMLGSDGRVQAVTSAFTVGSGVVPAPTPVTPVVPSESTLSPTRATAPKLAVKRKPTKRASKGTRLTAVIATTGDVDRVQLFDGHRKVGTATRTGNTWTIKWKASQRGHRVYQVRAVGIDGVVTVAKLGKVTVR